MKSKSTPEAEIQNAYEAAVESSPLATEQPPPTPAAPGPNYWEARAIAESTGRATSDVEAEMEHEANPSSLLTEKLANAAELEADLQNVRREIQEVHAIQTRLDSLERDHLQKGADIVRGTELLEECKLTLETGMQNMEDWPTHERNMAGGINAIFQAVTARACYAWLADWLPGWLERKKAELASHDREIQAFRKANRL